MFRISSTLAQWFGYTDTAAGNDVRTKELLRQLRTAATFEEWQRIALLLDHVSGLNEWKRTNESLEYNWRLVEDRLKRLIEVQSWSNVHKMTRQLRSELFRKLGGMANPRLYTHCHTGTKYLIEEYVETVCQCLDGICDTDWGPEFGLQEKFDFFFETRQAFGRSALCLSGGATLGMYHLGVLKALHEQNLLPRVISGSSVGSIVASIVATRSDAELEAAFSLEDVRFEAFESKGSAGRKFWRLLSRGVLMDVKKLELSIRQNLGDITFQESYERTKRILNITVSSTSQHEMPRLLNYLTAPNVLIWSAAAASCALSLLYEPICLMAKDEDGKIVPYHPSGLKWTDGSVETDLPMQRLSELFNINHFIVSQVNPHVLPVLTLLDEHKDSIAGKMLELIADEVRHRITQISRLGFLQSLAVIVNQKYSGDITIVPDWSSSDYLRLLSNPDKEWMLQCMRKSERKTWKKISQIRQACAIELTLDRCMKRVEHQLKQAAHHR